MNDLAPLIVPFLWFAVMATVVLVAWTRRKNLLPARMRAAARLALRYDEGAFAVRPVIEGHGPHGVVRIRFIGGKGAHTRYEAAGAERGIEISREGFGSAVGKVFRGADVEIGDPAFDDAVLVRGEEAWLVAHLDAERRAAIVQLLARNHPPALDDGMATMRRPGVIAGEEELVADGSAVMDLVHLLHADGSDLVPKLARNAANDPLPAVRRRNLRVLLERWRADPRAEKALAKALEDPDFAVRLDAAAYADAATQSRIALPIADDTNGHPADRLNALRLLCGSDRAAAAARSAIAVRFLALDLVREIAIDVLASCGDSDAVEPLRKIGGGKARDAIAKIQARLPGAEQGQLSVSELEGEAGGRLSLPEKRKT